ncbi:MAG: glycerophosphoryl diester phosphodiesterase [Gammaproteobacteria bacterium]
MASNNLLIKPSVIAHRGASLYAPENTLAAFRKAKELGVTWVEFDVMLTLDDEVVVIHDETLERTTNGVGRVCDFPLSYLKTLDAGSWFNLSFANERIPTLHEVIALLNQLKLSANIEIKAQPGKEESTVKKVLRLVEQHWNKEQAAPLISSFNLPILELVSKYSPTSMLGFLMDTWESDWKKICDNLHAISVNVNQNLLDPEKVNQIKATQRTLLAYTVNDPKRADELYAWGVDAVFSDEIISLL